MTDLQIRILFLILGLSITTFWTLTSPYEWKKFLFAVTANRIRSGITFITVWVIFQSALPFELKFPSFRFDQTLTTIGIAIGVIGVLFACWAKYTMKTSWGVPAQHDPDKQRTLVTKGPFAFSRNPIYVGLLLYLLGFEIARKSMLIIMVVPAFVLVHRAVIIEEKLLTKIFGDEYIKYQKRAPRYL